MQQEYIVTLHNFEDLESFYDDMETPGGNLYIPDRNVELVDRRLISRNTHYMLTADEAELIKNDPRVKNVELNFKDRGLFFKPLYVQESTLWNKSQFVQQLHKNWGLLRSFEGEQRSNWGIDGTTSQSGVINTTSSGKNVDVVIIDGCMNPAHPEFAVNPDGTGGSRVIQYNWLQLRPFVTGGPVGTYKYTPYVDPSYPDYDLDGYSDRTVNNDHGTHVAGIAAGNSNGWARDANIYNINPYGSAPTTIGATAFLDYLRYWHNTKPINPLTGVRNPTIVNNSYGISVRVSITSIIQIRFNNGLYTGPFTSEQLFNYGIYNDGTTAEFPVRASVAFETDIEDCINDGIIMIGAAGNEFSKVENPSLNLNDSYNNYLTYVTGLQQYFSYYYAQGSSPGCSPGVISVGSISATVNETKSEFSNCGPRVDIYAPGDLIMSAVNSNLGVTVNDSRDIAFKNTKQSGTSMASPQVAGVIACYAEQNPRINQEIAKEFILKVSKINQMTDTGGGYDDLTSLQGSENRYLSYYKERNDNGLVAPKLNVGFRKQQGFLYPRNRIFKYG